MLSAVSIPLSVQPTRSYTPGPRLLPDTALFDRVIQGDSTALATLYDRYSRAVYALALRIVQQSSVAEDVTQDTFIRAWRVAPTLTEPVRDPAAWLMRIARNLALDSLRRQAVRPQPVATEDGMALFETAPDPAPEPELAITVSAQRHAIHRALVSLPHEQREAIELAFFEGLTHQAIAERQGLPLGTVKTRVRLGLRKLAVSLDGQV